MFIEFQSYQSIKLRRSDMFLLVPLLRSLAFADTDGYKQVAPTELQPKS